MSEELARAKLIKRGADHDLMQALKLVIDMKAQLETAQSERNTLWDAMKPVALLLHRLEDSERKWVDIVKEIPNRFESYCRISGWPIEGVNRPIKTNTQTFIKFTLRHCRSGGRHCWTRTAALPHLQTTLSHSSKLVNGNLDWRNFSAYCRYDSHRS